jgi:hypothetical protein
VFPRSGAPKACAPTPADVCYLARPVPLAKTLISPELGQRLERAYLAALAELAPVVRPTDAGLALLRELAGARDTRDPRGNPYWRLVTELPARVPQCDPARLLRAMRPVLVTTYAYAVPTDPVLDRIAHAGDIVEVGAGGGYWARCLHERGAAITAFDRTLPVEQVRPGGRLIQHHPVGIGGPAEALAAAPAARTLLLCWPPGLINRDEVDAGAAPVFSPMGNEALDRFAGDHLVFVGDRIASFGSPRFFDRLDSEWLLQERLPLPNLGRWKDSAGFYRRNRALIVP